MSDVFHSNMCPEGTQVELQSERCVPKVLKLSSAVSECKPLAPGDRSKKKSGGQRKKEKKERELARRDGRGSHSSTFLLNVSSFCGIRWVHDVPPVY